MSILAPLHPPTWVLATLCGLLVALAGAGEGRRRLLWLLPALLLQGLAWDVSSQHGLIGVVVVAMLSRPALPRRAWLGICLLLLGTQGAVASTLRPDVSACRQIVHPPRPVQGSPRAWGPATSLPLDGLPLKLSGSAPLPVAARRTLDRMGPVEPPFDKVGRATLVAAPRDTELVLTLGAGPTITPEERVTRSVHIPVERGLERVEVELDLSELVAGNWDEQARIGSVELTGGTLISLELVEANARFQGLGGSMRVESEGVVRPSIWLRAGVTATLTLPTDAGEVRFTPAARGEATPHLRRDGRTLTLWVEGKGIGLFGDPRLALPQEQAPVVLLVLADTLRWDRATTPTLTRLADTGLVFSNAWSTSAWTKPAIPSLMTGLEPSTHRVGATGVGDRLPDSVVTLQDRFREAGWRTGSFSASPLGSTLSGLDQGFGAAYAPRRWGLDRGKHHPTADRVHADLLEWLGQEPDQPAFVYLHAMDVHEYETRRPVVSLVSDYDDAVAEWDAELGRLLERLPSQTMVVVTSDHGESFWDHGVSRHGTGLWSSQTRIPWIIHNSGLTGVVEHPVSLVDVAPTILELAGLPQLGRADGLYALRRGGPVFSSLIRFSWKPDQPTAVAIVDGGLHRIEREDGLRVGYSTDADPCEARSVDSSTLEGLLRQWRLASVGKAERFTQEHGPVGAAVTQDDLERLRSLGYIQ